MKGSTLRTWGAVHTWTSLICTVFLLLLCISGLAMIWLRDLDANFAGHPRAPPAAASAPLTNLDRVFADAERRSPGEHVAYADWAFEGDLIGVNLAAKDKPRAHRQLVYDAHTGAFLEDLRKDNPNHPMRVFLGFMNRLHIQLFLGLPGEFFLAAMAVLFIVATVSGLVIYAPFSAKDAFGVVRAERSPRTLWRDIHNLLGVATAAWVLIVATTGVMNAFTVPAYAAWRQGVVPALTAPFKTAAAPLIRIGPAEAVALAERVTPGSRMIRVVAPGGPNGSPRHYVVWTQGDRPVTRKLFRPLLIDAETGAVALSKPPPWWLSALQLSRPLHFGDYGFWPLKVLWSLMDLIAIAILCSGIYLWAARLGGRRPMRLATDG